MAIAWCIAKGTTPIPGAHPSLHCPCGVCLGPFSEATRAGGPAPAPKVEEPPKLRLLRNKAEPRLLTSTGSQETVPQVPICSQVHVVLVPFHACRCMRLCCWLWHMQSIPWRGCSKHCSARNAPDLKLGESHAGVRNVRQAEDAPGNRGPIPGWAMRPYNPHNQP